MEVIIKKSLLYSSSYAGPATSSTTRLSP